MPRFKIRLDDLFLIGQCGYRVIQINTNHTRPQETEIVMWHDNHLIIRRWWWLQEHLVKRISA